MFIGTRHNDRAGDQVLVIGNQDAALTSIDHLVGLERETADLADGPDALPMPLGAKRVGCILDDRDAALIRQRHDRVHIGGMAAHVTDHDRADAVVELRLEIRHIDTVVLANIDQDRLAIRVHNR